MNKVIFISGMSGGRRDMFLTKNILKEFEVIYFSYDTTLTEPLENYAQQLKNFIAGLKLRKNEKVSIVSLSGGGLIAYYYICFLDKNKVDKLVTVCTPFGGTWIWRLFSKSRKGVRQVRKNSSFLKKLEHADILSVKELNLWCAFDPLVFGTSGKASNSKHTLFFLHWIIQFWLPIIYQIRRFLRN
jgi:pimeloyl-ACP methyl ester carboxylesterase